MNRNDLHMRAFVLIIHTSCVLCTKKGGYLKKLINICVTFIQVCVL